jgi:5-methylcytosine-specific restriction endonuclease McrA
VRCIVRKDLPPATKKALDSRQSKANEKRAACTLDIQQEWKSARQTKPIRKVLTILKSMAGERQRCMYCGDSHGTDIEHFWPKTPYPERMFHWPNLLLCCTECGRYKGDRFPVDNGAAVLLGNIAARFDIQTNDWSQRGMKTVEILQLDRREALNASYLKTWRRLRIRLEAAIHETAPDKVSLVNALRDADDHGLLGWCVTGTGRNVAPIDAFRSKHPDVWNACEQALIGN